jgi:hypothetical protein
VSGFSVDGGRRLAHHRGMTIIREIVAKFIAVPVIVHEHLVEDSATEGARRNIAMSHILRTRRNDKRLEERVEAAEGRYQRLRDDLENAGYEHLVDQHDQLEWDR